MINQLRLIRFYFIKKLFLFYFSAFIGKIALADKELRITRAFIRLVQEMWKVASGPGPASNNGIADPSGFRREMTVFAPKFGGYDQVTKYVG